MSIQATQEGPLAVTSDYAAPQAPAKPEVRRGFVAQVLADTFANYRARFSVVWIGILVLCAVFAPFLASSHPLLMKKAGRWSSPLLRHLTPSDVILLVTFFFGVVLLFWRSLNHRFLTFWAV